IPPAIRKGHGGKSPTKWTIRAGCRTAAFPWRASKKTANRRRCAAPVGKRTRAAIDEGPERVRHQAFKKPWRCMETPTPNGFTFIRPYPGRGVDQKVNYG